MRSWGYKIILKYFAPISKNPIKYLSCAFALLGAFYTLVEIEQSIWSSEILLTFFRNNLAIIIFVIIFISIIIYREKLEFSAFLGTKDDKITLKMSDLFKLKDTAIVIPTNTTFDTTMNGDFISEKSVQGQFQRKYYGIDFAELDKSLQFSLDEQYPNDYIELNDRNQTKRKRYGIGTVSKVTREKTHYYFLAVADISKRGKPENVTMQNMTQALVSLWDFIYQKKDIQK